jgi:hypothetical protein
MGRRKCIGFLVLVLLLVFFMVNQSEAQGVGSVSCIRCHETWRDNSPTLQDIQANNVDFDYVPPFITTIQQGSFYTIPEGYLSSMHNSPMFNPTATDYVTCEACHGSGVGHQGIGAIPMAIPDAKTCSKCHNETIGFPYKQFVLTSHGQTGFSAKPTKNFDQPSFGKSTSQATFPLKQGFRTTRLPLFKADGNTMVTRNERLEECSACHNYALQSAQFKRKIGTRSAPNPGVSCAACHNAHYPGPDGNHLLPVNVLKVTDVSGSTVTGVTPTQSRTVSYRNLKPYKVGADGGQDFANGTWGRGSLVSRPNTKIIGSPGMLADDGVGGISNRLIYAAGGFLANVKHEDTVLISGVATAQVQIPATADPAIAGQFVTVQTTLTKAGFEVERVVDDNTLALLPGVKAGNVTVRYLTNTGATATLTVPGLTFTGQVEFEVRNMRTNSEDLCGSCHTQTTYKFTAVGKNKDGTVNPAVTPATHNQNILGQYKNSGHGNIQNLAFAEFSAFEYGSSHQVTYPFDMGITGSGGVGSSRNPSNTTNQLLIGALDPTKLGLVALNKLTQPVLINNYPCNQCHHGLGSIDYQKNRHGTPDAQVLWGDATVTCVTCHEPHADATKSKKNIRVPTYLSFNSRFTEVNGRVNKFLDGTAIPSGVKDGIICLFCHQGRESGLTIYKAMKTANPALDPYATPDALISAGGISFVNPHYLDGGAILWSKNGWEYFFSGVAQRYTTGYAQHQQTNCAGCHMGEANANNTEGGHTWKPNIETCQKCHGPINDFKEISALVDYNGNGVIETTYNELGTIAPRPAPGVGSTGTGLFGAVVAALETKGIFYNPDAYPYFYTAAGAQFRAFTPNTLSAAFNLAYSYKAGNAVYVHNAKYNIQLLRDALQTLNGGVVPPGVRPAGNRDATYYPNIDLTKP